MRPPESFIGQPVRSLQTMLRVISESDNTLPRIVPDGIYGKQTVAAVSAFQRKYGLQVTGITDQATWDAVVSVYEPALVLIDEAQPLYIILDPLEEIEENQRNPNIYLVQSMLIVFASAYDGLIAPEVTGILDIPTAQALRSFQEQSGLPPTGKLDKQTWKHLALQYPSASMAAIENYSELNSSNSKNNSRKFTG